MSLNVKNCPQCGRVFARTFHDVCPACVKDIEEQYQRCWKYLRENKTCTMHELSDETNVSIRQITKFVQEGRLSLKGAPNMTYPCESCGEYIREHTLCTDCRNKLAKDISRAQQSVSRTAANPASSSGGNSFNIRKRD